MTLRAALDGLFDLAAYVAALFLVGTLAMVAAGIAGRLLGFHIPGTDAYAGYFMAGSAFLAAAHTLKRGEHIRVTLLLDKASRRTRRALELWSLGAASLLAGLFAIFSVRLAYQSWLFNDVSTANDATPLWIPQLAMAAGTLILAAAFADELVLQGRGRAPPAAPAATLRNE
jgi:TRAP-type C4-dicarboxylate transport system permease small subunit